MQWSMRRLEVKPPVICYIPPQKTSDNLPFFYVRIKIPADSYAVAYGIITIITTLIFFHILGLESVRVRLRDKVSGSGLCQYSFIYKKLYDIVRHRFLGVLA